MHVPQLLKFWLMHILISAQLVLAALSHCHGYGFLQEVCASHLIFHIYTWNPFLLHWPSRVTYSAYLNSRQTVCISMTEVWSNNVPFTLFCSLNIIWSITGDVTNGNILCGQDGKLFFPVVERVGDIHRSVSINLFPFSLFVCFFLSLFLSFLGQSHNALFQSSFYPWGTSTLLAWSDVSNVTRSPSHWTTFWPPETWGRMFAGMINMLFIKL